MVAQRTSTSPQPQTGRRSLALAGAVPTAVRVSEYEAVFGPLSPLHQHGSPVLSARSGMNRLRALVHLPSRA